MLYLFILKFNISIFTNFAGMIELYIKQILHLCRVFQICLDCYVLRHLDECFMFLFFFLGH
jgi:hypothetical protein